MPFITHLQRHKRDRVHTLLSHFFWVRIFNWVCREIWQTSTPTKLLTAFKIIKFSMLWFQAKITTLSSLFNQSQKCSALCSANHTAVGHVSFGRSIYLHFLLMSSTLPKPEWIDRTKKEDKFQIEKLMRMLRKCFITFKKIVKVSVKAHMILVSFLCHSPSFFSSFSTNKLLNVWVKPHACACVCVFVWFLCLSKVNWQVQAVVPLAGNLLSSCPGGRGRGSVFWQDNAHGSA